MIRENQMINERYQLTFHFHNEITSLNLDEKEYDNFYSRLKEFPVIKSFLQDTGSLAPGKNYRCVHVVKIPERRSLEIFNLILDEREKKNQ